MRCGHLAAIVLLAFSCRELAHAQQAAPQSAAPPPSCDTPENRQFDFWVGSWDVYPAGTTQLVAHSLIEKLYAGCAIRENWMPLGKEVNGGGGSLSLYDAKRRQWRQTWIDSTGTRVDLDGGFSKGVMSITGLWANFAGPGKDALVRMNYERQPDGQVRQWAESSTDDGRTWQPSFDFLYRHVDAFPDF